VIPVYGQFARTLACLRALAAHPAAARRSASSSTTVDGRNAGRPAPVEGLRYHRRAENGGFIAACNDGASLARGEYVVFLNNDTIPQPGGSTPCCARSTTTRTSAWSARNCCIRWRLQEAGGVVFTDGSAGTTAARIAGRLPLRLRAAMRLRERRGDRIATRRCSPNSAASPRLRAGVLRRTPTRLRRALRAACACCTSPIRGRARRRRHRGHRRQRRAQGLQVRNQGTFAARWRDALATHPHPARFRPRRAAARTPQVLIDRCADAAPGPRFGSLRLVNSCACCARKARTSSSCRPIARNDGAATHALQQLGVECWHAPFAPRAPAWLREHGRRFDTIVSEPPLRRLRIPAARTPACTAGRVVFDTVDLHYLREARGAELANDARAARCARGRARSNST
jgi:hypothetical protein